MILGNFFEIAGNLHYSHGKYLDITSSLPSVMICISLILVQ